MNFKKKYCCHNFQYRHEADANMGLNIRIITHELNGIVIQDNPYGFYITEGYEADQKHIKSISINFCPFCGANLTENYSSQKYVNAQSEDFIKF